MRMRDSSADSAAREHPSSARSGCGPQRGPVNLLDLQRLAGNTATTYAVQAASAPPVQRKKSPEERGQKNKRVTFAQREIPPLAALVPAKLTKHVFDALPMDKPFSKDDPQGLHAYQDDGSLPPGVVVEGHTGSPTKVHALRWRWDTSTKQKAAPGSTMFPAWMPRLHVLALISLRLGNKTPHVSAVETYIKRGAEISLEKSGDTVYPV